METPVDYLQRMNHLICKAYSEGIDTLSEPERDELMKCPGFDMGRYTEHERGKEPLSREDIILILRAILTVYGGHSLPGPVHGHLKAILASLESA